MGHKLLVSQNGEISSSTLFKWGISFKRPSIARSIFSMFRSKSGGLITLLEFFLFSFFLKIKNKIQTHIFVNCEIEGYKSTLPLLSSRVIDPVRQPIG